MKSQRACRQHIVLLGVGHTNAHIVKMWAMQPLPDTDLTCISDSGVATYSGFLPAVLAGQLPEQAMEIDLVQLCAAAGARLITNRVKGLDRSCNQVLFDDRPPVSYDALSIGVGSVPTLPATGADSPALVQIKPMRTFLPRLQQVVQNCAGSGPLNVVVVGGGAAGVEVSLCLPARLKTLTDRDLNLTLINSATSLLPGCTTGTVRRVSRILTERGHQVVPGRVEQVQADHVLLDDGSQQPADVVVWAASATAAPFLSSLDLPVDDRGFLSTNATLRSTSGDPVFAVGDCGTIQGVDLPKAGVYAVRQGPVLWQNLQRLLQGQSLQGYRPQTSFLKLLNTGDGRAVGEWKGFSFEGASAWRLKMNIDQKFMDMYQQLPQTMAMPDEMPCKGCGCKLGNDPLRQGLNSSSDEPGDDAVLLPRMASDSPAEAPEDVSQQDVLVTTDFFSLPLDDAWLNGRITAVHAASDLYAMGASPFAAESIVVLPEGDAATQQTLLRDFREGADHEFRRMGAVITGGHTITGPRFDAGFSVFGRPAGTRLIRKQGLKPGDHLLLTQPLGSGILLAAWMRGQCGNEHYQTLIDTMLIGNQSAAALAIECGIQTGTDITGFGLLGHLQEMLTEDVQVELDIAAVPFLPGAVDAHVAGVGSSLLPSNRTWLKGVEADRPEFLDLLIDPQTCGGLLLAVSEEQRAKVERRLESEAIPGAAWIGKVQPTNAGDPRVRVLGQPANCP